jgi:hypothetical protein
VKQILVVGLVLAGLTSACGHGGSSAGPSGQTTVPPVTTPPTAASTGWRALPAGALGPGLTRIVDIASRPSGLVAVGSVTTNGTRVPALWSSSDGVRWTRLQTQPKSPYGFESELTTVAATPDGRVAAIGQAVGGAHGNPRIGSWYLDGSTLREVVAPVELYGGPRQGSVDQMAAGPTGFVIAGTRTDRNNRTGAAVWTSPDAHDEFVIDDTDRALESQPGEIVRAIGAAGSANGYLAVGDRTAQGRIDDDALAWTSADGRRWSRVQAAPAVFGGSGAELAQLATNWGRGWAAAGVVDHDGLTSLVVWTSTDGVTWRRTELTSLGRDPDPLSAVTSLTTDGDKLLLGARLGERFVAASSTDGAQWTPIGLPVLASADPHALLLVMPLGGRLAVAATSTDGTRLWSSS